MQDVSFYYRDYVFGPGLIGSLSKYVVLLLKEFAYIILPCTNKVNHIHPTRKKLLMNSKFADTTICTSGFSQ